MSDDLVKRLRTPVGFQDIPFIQEEAADYIEQLERACGEWAEVSQNNYQRAKAAEDKLAKAIEALKKLDRRGDSLETFDNAVHEIVSATLAELKG